MGSPEPIISAAAPVNPVVALTRTIVLYDLRHTCLTRWAKVLDPFTLKKLAGHTDLNTTMRYVHLNDDDVRAAMGKVQGGHKIGHTANSVDLGEGIKTSVSDSAFKG